MAEIHTVNIVLLSSQIQNSHSSILLLFLSDWFISMSVTICLTIRLWCNCMLATWSFKLFCPYVTPAPQMKPRCSARFSYCCVALVWKIWERLLEPLKPHLGPQPARVWIEAVFITIDSRYAQLGGRQGEARQLYEGDGAWWGLGAKHCPPTWVLCGQLLVVTWRSNFFPWSSAPLTPPSPGVTFWLRPE